ncbi:MAG: elongation factor P [Bacteroidia bacterium]|nr:elongation factor P [Bacteroidia bacterium]
MANAADVRMGLVFRYNGDICVVSDFQHVKVARGGAFVRIKMRSIRSGRVTENTFNPADKLEEVPVQYRHCQYLFEEGSTLVFMDQESFEQIPIEKAHIESLDLMAEGEVVDVLVNLEDDSPLTLQMPRNIVREVVYTEPGLKGDSSGNTLKPARINTGAEIRVPLFVEIGDHIRIDTASRTYMERVKV